MKKYFWLIAIVILLILAVIILKLTYNFVVQTKVNVEKALNILKENEIIYFKFIYNIST